MKHDQEMQDSATPCPALTPLACSPLEWEYSTDGTEIRGCLKSRKDTTIFLIMVCKDRAARGTMTGAFIPDGADGNGHLERALIPFLKASASIYLREYYEDLREVLEPENPSVSHGGPAHD